MISSIKRLLQAEYGLLATDVEQTTGGWSADAYIARTADSGYFVKVYDKNRPSVGHWIARIGDYTPAVLWLYANTPLKDRMIAPLPTLSGGYKVESAARVVLLFPLIHGAALCEARMTRAQAEEIAEILAELHAHGREIGAPTEALLEDYAIPFYDQLSAYLVDPDIPEALHAALAPYAPMLINDLEVLKGLAQELKDSSPPCVLCHTDVHGWNLMQSDRLILIDWEGLRLAPAESDLFSFSDGFFFDYAGEAFFPRYAKARGGSVINETAMRFYRLRRRLEDIAEFANSIINDALTPEEFARSLKYMERECVALREER